MIIEAGSNQWRNYVFESQVRVVNLGSPPIYGDVFSMEFRKNLSGKGDFHALIFSEKFIQIGVTRSWNYSNIHKMEGVEPPIDTWFSARLEVTDDYVRGYINGWQVIETKSYIPLESGGIGFTVPPTTYEHVVWFDDVRVVELAPADESASADISSIIAAPLELVSSTDCTQPSWEITFTNSLYRSSLDALVTVNSSLGFYSEDKMERMDVGETERNTFSFSTQDGLPGDQPSDTIYWAQYEGSGGSETKITWNCQTGELIDTTYTPAQ